MKEKPHCRCICKIQSGTCEVHTKQIVEVLGLSEWKGFGQGGGGAMGSEGKRAGVAKAQKSWGGARAHERAGALFEPITSLSLPLSLSNPAIQSAIQMPGLKQLGPSRGSAHTHTHAHQLLLPC